MQFTVGCLGDQDGFNATAEILASAPYSAIRTMTVGETTTSYYPLSQLAVAPTLPWSVAGPASIGFGNWSATSAVCWFYARDLYDALQVPIGAVSRAGSTTPQTQTAQPMRQRRTRRSQRASLARRLLLMASPQGPTPIPDTAYFSML